MFRIVINCGPCEAYIAKCLASLLAQSFVRWKAYVTVDPCGDRTFEEAVLAGGGDRRIEIHVNSERQYSMVNLIHAIGRSGAAPEDIVVVLDGDDWFATPDALRIIHHTYQQPDCWMTYGSWEADSRDLEGMRAGRWPAYSAETTD